MKKAVFLQHVVTTLALPAVVHPLRIENFVVDWRQKPDAITARGLAPLNILLSYVAPLLKKPGQALLLKGQDVGVELTEASKYWNMTATLAPSKTSPDGRIVIVRALQRRDNKA
jgi:16S rRNA (guanine527-N7)-methyltransferase